MENMILFAIAGLSAFALVKLIAAPLRLGARILLRGLCGFACLWLLNCASSVTGLQLPVNTVTVLLSGGLGLPGVALVALLAVI